MIRRALAGTVRTAAPRLGRSRAAPEAAWPWVRACAPRCDAPHSQCMMQRRGKSSVARETPPTGAAHASVAARRSALTAAAAREWSPASSGGGRAASSSAASDASSGSSGDAGGDAELRAVLELLNGFRRSQVLFAACELGVLDALARAPGGRAAADVARELRGGEGDARAVAELLDACVALGLARKHWRGEGAQAATYTCSRAAQRLLVRSAPDHLVGYVRHSARVLYPLWGELGSAVREGGHRWQQVFGDAPSGVFAALYDTPEALEGFADGMASFGVLSAPAVVRAAGDALCAARHLVDLGGGTGYVALEACMQHPQLRATVVDLPSVCALGARRLAAAEDAAAARVSFKAADFFSDELPRADAYYLGRIAHDWSDEDAAKLLTRVAAALPPDGVVILGEMLLDDDRCGPPDALLQSLNMLVQTEGRERTVAEFSALLREAGFGDAQPHRTGLPLDVVVARKPR